MGTSGKIKEEGEGGPEKEKEGEGRGAEGQREVQCGERERGIKLVLGKREG